MQSLDPEDVPENHERKEHRIELANFLFRTAGAQGGVVYWWSLDRQVDAMDGPAIFPESVAVECGTDALQYENSMHLNIERPDVDFEDMDVLALRTAPDARGVNGEIGWTVSSITKTLDDYWAAEGLSVRFRYAGATAREALSEVLWSSRGGPCDMSDVEDLPDSEHPRARPDGSVDE